MADMNDRGRRMRRRGGYGGRRREDAYSPTPPPMRPIILAKPAEKASTPEYAAAASGSEPQRSSPTFPLSGEKGVIISRPPQDDVSGAGTPPGPSVLTSSSPVILQQSSQQDVTPPQPIQVTVASSGKPSPALTMGHVIIEGSSQSRLAPPPEMLQSVRLVDDAGNWCDSGMEVLQDQTDFFTIGVIGLQGAGKSTLMSMLAGNTVNDSSRSLAFRPQTKDSVSIGAHQTNTMDMMITPERVILIDTQPILSPSVLYHLVHPDKKISTEFTTAENCIEMQSLQMVSFLMTVCNIILVVMDWFVDVNLLRFLQTSEMLKPATPPPSHDASTSEDYGDLYPHVVFVLNEAKRDDFTVDNYTTMQDMLSRMLEHSKLHHKGFVNMSRGGLIPGLNSRTMRSNINLFLLPKMDKDQGSEDSGGIISLIPEYRGHLLYEDLIRHLRNQLFALPRYPITHVQLSEKNWFHYAARTWESVKKSSLFSEYNRFLP